MPGRFPIDRTSDRRGDEGFLLDAPETPRPSRRRERTETSRPNRLDRTASAELSHIGRRGPFRPEVIALLLGIAFVAAALVKPWPGSPRAAAGSPSAAVAVATASDGVGTPAAPTASPTINVYALIPPYNYRLGPYPPPMARMTATPTPLPVTAWTGVDWTFLASLDTHDRWGVSALTLPNQAPSDGTPNPSVSWTPEIAPWSPSVLAIPGGSSAYALAITWPSGLRVTTVSIDYLGAADSRPTVDMPVVSPASHMTPVSALAVATPSDRSGPTATPAYVDGGLVSGTYWIAPSSDLTSPTPAHVQAAWQSTPWAWPLGMYRATLLSNAGTMLVVLELVAS